MRNDAAEPKYATAEIAVWWDIVDCPIPEGYEAHRVRPSIEGAFKKLGYSGPVSITAYGDQTQTPDNLLRGLSSTGVHVAHAITESTCALMYSDMVEWRRHIPPPATMMFISNQVDHVFSLDLARLQQETQYNLFLAYSVSSKAIPALETSAEWRWNNLLKSKTKKTRVVKIYEEEESDRAMFYCKSCDFDCQSLRELRKHLSSRYHAMGELLCPTATEISPVTMKWGRNFPAKPEYATAKILVLWDIVDCPIPEGYEVHRVRPSIEGAFKKLGYSGPVSITAYGDQSQTPDHLLRGLSSTGVAVSHAITEVRYRRMFYDLIGWQDLNPPPATIMLISDHIEDYFSTFVAGLQQCCIKYKYNMFLAYSFRPNKMLALVTSAEWLWESLLEVSETRRHVLQRCSSQTGEPESTRMFDCETCLFDCKSLDDFMKHLSTNEHAWEAEEDIPKSKRLRKAFRTGFRSFHIHHRGTRRLTNRGAKKCQ
ncbi:uncharacterized protein LOC9300671 isoform X2 [Arabidopsis lyrata subsp. lyrata]|uniref:uncharacterized protein LOC9300671 isoform X2 n=1 Tax=Arabidopsis lyrata subsp. lyrata TaxID=81972 RepID=UPI000A29BC0C|nr:uncharacterized protein LOC9300671 isoform X2 [Arabidopsis lyrata subsp. lyrata]|eukprot:XP_020871772.1 uncharacterized protein LOC9300671 isoform X2 [Arabidopsis lyrata subsp. lyrata]